MSEFSSSFGAELIDAKKYRWETTCSTWTQKSPIDFESVALDFSVLAITKQWTIDHNLSKVTFHLKERLLYLDRIDLVMSE